MGKYCTNCGKELHTGARFCAKCGAAVLDVPANPVPAAQPKPVPPMQPIVEAQPQKSAPPAVPPKRKNTAAPKKNGGRNTLCIVLSVLLLIQIAAVALYGWPGFMVGGGSGKSDRPIVSMPAVSQERATLEQAGAIATRLFILANLKTDALLEYDINRGSMEELQDLTADALETWRLCDVASAQVIELTDYAQELGVQASIQPAQMRYVDHVGPSFPLFTTVAYAAEENAAVKWARELTEKYDSYPAGQKVRQLAENLGTDAKKAYAQLQMAQNILEGAAYSAEGDTMQSFENAAMATKTVCKTGLYIGGVVAGGGVANGILEAGGMIIGGVDTIVDIASTGSTIICGENSKVTMAANDFKDFMGPISSVTGGVNVLSGGIKFAGTTADKVGSIDKLSYIGESVLDLVRDGKILGGLITVGEDGQTTVTMTEIDVEGKTPAEIEKELEKVGLSLPDEEAKTAAELAQGLEEEYFYTEEEISEITAYLRELLYDMFLEQEEELTPPSAEEEQPTGYNDLSLDEIVGSYDVSTSFQGETQTHATTFSKSGDKLTAENAEDYLEMDYDPTTGKATVTQTHEDGEDIITVYTTFVFKRENGVITISGKAAMSLNGEPVALSVGYSGVKTD
ncbi:zinc-ribbon domain-containing protein [Sedimentibacter sp.]|uniref:zinc-ribbon domain-containing protein n=1 Tax=Sedimentibacter sp. TaxID=1960295 RepID=UPI0028A64FE9|nr:zinc-ribbon domain-containing protein [Sedimentibacter sp.]